MSCRWRWPRQAALPGSVSGVPGDYGNLNALRNFGFVASIKL